MTSAQRTASDLIKASSSSGELGVTERLSSAKRCCRSGAASAFRTSALRRCTISRGVAAGAVRPNQVSTSESLARPTRRASARRAGGRAPGRGDGQSPERAGLHLAGHHRDIGEQQRHLAGQHVGDRRRLAAVGDVGHADAGIEQEQLGRHVRRRADAARGEVDAAGLGLGHVDQLAHRLGGKRRVGDQHQRRGAEQGDTATSRGRRTSPTCRARAPPRRSSARPPSGSCRRGPPWPACRRRSGRSRRSCCRPAPGRAVLRTVSAPGGPYFPPAFGIHPGPAGAFC